MSKKCLYPKIWCLLCSCKILGFSMLHPHVILCKNLQFYCSFSTDHSIFKVLKENWFESDECLKIAAKIFSSMFINHLKLGWFNLAIEHTDYNNINVLDWKSGTIYNHCTWIKSFLVVNWNSRNFNIQNFERELHTFPSYLNNWQLHLQTLFSLDNIISTWCVKGFYLER